MKQELEQVEAAQQDAVLEQLQELVADRRVKKRLAELSTQWQGECFFKTDNYLICVLKQQPHEATVTYAPREKSRLKRLYWENCLMDEDTRSLQRLKVFGLFAATITAALLLTGTPYPLFALFGYFAYWEHTDDQQLIATQHFYERDALLPILHDAETLEAAAARLELTASKAFPQFQKFLEESTELQELERLSIGTEAEVCLTHAETLQLPEATATVEALLAQAVQPVAGFSALLELQELHRELAAVAAKRRAAEAAVERPILEAQAAEEERRGLEAARAEQAAKAALVTSAREQRVRLSKLLQEEAVAAEEPLKVLGA